MKILHIEGGRNFYGGAQQVLYLLEGLAARGIDNVLVCPAGSELSQRAVPFATVQAIGMGGDLDLRLIPRILCVIRAVRPDVVHLHSRIGGDVMGGIAARLAGVPVVHSRRVDNTESRFVVALKYRLFDRVIAISEQIGRIKLAEGIPAAKLRCVHSAVDPAPYRRVAEQEWFRAEFTLPAQGPVLGVVAQLISRKGHRYLLQCLPALRRRFPDLAVLFLGRGPLEAELRDMTRRDGLEQGVRFAGFRPDLARILPCLDLLVHPALAEGLGVSLLQAACAGVPIVAFRAGGVPEVVHDGRTGLLVEPADAAGLGVAIAALLADPARSRAMGAAGRELVEREFAVARMVEGNLAVYRELLDAPARA